MARDIHDHYFRQAKRDGYRSRAAYKLLEIDDRKHILRAGDFVLDCGAAPGSWLQVAAQRVGRKGFAIGIDKKPIEGNFKETNLATIEGDFTLFDNDELFAPLPPKKTPDPFFRVLLSDMAPFTTGDRTIDHHKSIRLCQSLLDRCGELLGKRGNLVMKVFEGEAYADLLAQTRTMFDKVKGFKPKASRGESTEIYVVAHGYKGPNATPLESEAQGELDPRDQLPTRKPSQGWS